MRRTWPPIAAGSHYSPTRENARAMGGSEAEKEEEERRSNSTLHALHTAIQGGGKKEKGEKNSAIQRKIWIAVNRLWPRCEED